MALSVKVGRFSSATSTGNQAITGVGFQPKIVLFFGSNIAASATADYLMILGCAVSTSQRWSLGTKSLDAVGTTATRRFLRTDRCVAWTNSSGTTLAAADLVSLDSDGFTLNWSVVEGITARPVGFMALGGSDLTDVFAGSFDLTTSASDQAVTGVGFAPDAVCFAGCIANTTEGAASGGAINFGAITASDQWALSNVDENAVSAVNGNSGQRTDRCFQQLSFAGAATPSLSRASLDSDGFTVTKNVAPVSDRRVCFFCLKGASIKLGAFNKPTSATTGAVTGVGFTPKGLLLASWGLVSSTSVATSAWWGMGATDGTTGFTASAVSDDGSDPSQTSSSAEDIAFEMCDSSGATVFDAAFDSFDSDGFTLDWLTSDATARQMLYLAVGDTVVATGNRRRRFFMGAAA